MAQSFGLTQSSSRVAAQHFFENATQVSVQSFVPLSQFLVNEP
jgi:hypothetical protein